MPEGVDIDPPVKPSDRKDAPIPHSNDIEANPESNPLVSAIVDRLKGDDVVMVEHNNRERHGRTRVIVVDSEDDKTHMSIAATKQGEDRPDSVRLKWVNEGDNSSGSVQWVRNGSFGKDYISSNRVTYSEGKEYFDQILHRWRETGGYDMLDHTGIPLTKEQEIDLARTLQAGHTSVALTSAALTYLTTKLDSVQVDSSDQELLE